MERTMDVVSKSAIRPLIGTQSEYRMSDDTAPARNYQTTRKQRKAKNDAVPNDLRQLEELRCQ